MAQEVVQRHDKLGWSGAWQARVVGVANKGWYRVEAWQIRVAWPMRSGVEAWQIRVVWAWPMRVVHRHG